MSSNRADYLINLKKTSPAAVRDTWAALGSQTATLDTKYYVANTFFQVKMSKYDTADVVPELYNALVYCENDYRVDGDDFPLVDWENGTVNDIEGHCSIVSGIMSPHFRVILSGEEFASITAAIDTSYVPFKNELDTTSPVEISEVELVTLLTECGCPFVRVEELEYTREAIKTYCIKPNLEYFFGYMPLVIEQAYGSVASNQAFKVEFPKNAFNVVPYYTQGGTAAGSRGTAFGMYNELLMTGQAGFGGSGRFGRGLSYNKPVPGFTGGYSAGGTSALGASMDNLAATQAIINRFKREKFHVLRENGKKYATGYSSIGGNLCFKWLCISYNWDDIDLDEKWRVQALCKASILQNLGMLRALVPGDGNDKIDYTLYTNRAKDLRDPQIEFFNKTTSTQALAVGRGGLR